MNNYLSTSPAPLVADRAPYVAPSIEVIDVTTEGVIAGSGFSSTNPPGIGNGGSAYTNSSSAGRSYGASPASDIEDMINEILTIKE